jgi:hypothetical protein
MREDPSRQDSADDSAAKVINPYRQGVKRPLNQATTDDDPPRLPPTASSAVSSSSIRRYNELRRARQNKHRSIVQQLGATRQLPSAKSSAAIGTRIVRPGERVGATCELPISLNAWERFFGSLLRSPPVDFLTSFQQQEKKKRSTISLWETCCQRVGLSVPTTKLPAQYPLIRDSWDGAAAPNPDEGRRSSPYFDWHAALVLEEARYAIGQAVAARHATSATTKPAYGKSWTMLVHYVASPNAHGHFKILLKKASALTKEELLALRPCQVLECVPHCTAGTIHDAHLGVVANMTNREKLEESRTVTLYFFRPIPPDCLVESGAWTVTSLTTLVSAHRQFEAMVMDPAAVRFLPSLLGHARSTRAAAATGGKENDWFSEDDDDDDDGFLERGDDGTYYERSKRRVTPSPQLPESTPTVPRDDEASVVDPSGLFCWPTLNPTQERAATSFLQSAPSTITLIQGTRNRGILLLYMVQFFVR